MKENKNVPKLRFNDTKWHKYLLKNIIQINNEKFNPNKNNNENYKCIELEHLSQNTGILLNYLDSSNQKSIKNKFNKGMILFGKLRPYLNKFWFSSFDGVCSTEIWVFKTIEVPKFIYYLIQTNKFHNISNISSGSKMPRSDWNYMKEIEFSIPNKKTQLKIADFLSLIDKKIELLEKTLNLYKSLMKYYLKKIFSKEKILENGKHYKIKPLNKVTFYQEGPGVRNYQYKKEGIKLLNVGNFIQNNLVLNNTDRYISKEEAYGVYKHFLVDEGDLLIACSGIKAEYFDEKIAFARKEHLPLCMNTSTMRFKSLNSNELNLNYLKWFFQTEEFKKQIFKILTGSAQFNFGPTHLKYLKILILPIKEQILISNFLDLLKKYIDKNNNQIKLMNKLKKGLLEQMFC